MPHNLLKKFSPAKGFSLISSIFILVVLSLAVAFTLNVLSVSSRTVIFASLGTRAFFAAVSGAEWGAHQAINNNSCANATTLNLTQGDLSGFSVQVSCAQSSYTEGITVFQVYKIVSTATRGNISELNYVSRTIDVKVVQ